MPTLVALPADIRLRERRILDGLDVVMQVGYLEHLARVRRRGVEYIQLNSGRRTPASQEQLIQQTKDALSAPDSAAALARAGLTGITATNPAKPSLHLFGLAYDGEPVPKNEQTWRIYGEEAEALGMTWGGRWKRTLPSGQVVTDRPHVQAGGDRNVLIALASAGVFALLALAGAAVAAAAREQEA